MGSSGYSKSITGSMPAYLETCLKAVNDPYYFKNFRSLPEYGPVLECGFAGESATYLLNKGSPQILEKLKLFNQLDQIGNSVTNNIPGIGRFSGTTLRYIVIADQIMKFFQLPDQPTIAEIGAGFGGQCYVLSEIKPFSKYFIYDLPEVECLIEKVMKTLSVKKVSLMYLDEKISDEKVDLLISNYAFSECDRETQISYFERVLKKADRGYVIFNQINSYDTLSVDEFMNLLNEHQMNPKIYEEPIFTYQGNVLIVWDKTTN